MNDMSAPIVRDRSTYIGGSDIAKILGVSKFGTAYELFLEKRGEIGAKPEQLKVLNRGKRLEPAIVAMYADETGATVTYPGRQLTGAEPWMAGSFDAERHDEPCIIEAKSVSEFIPRSEWGPAGSDDVPKDYLAQAMWYMGIANVQRCDIAALLGADDFRIYPIAFDSELFGAMVAQARNFWARVQANEAPEPDFAHRSIGDVIARKFQVVDPKLIVQATPELIHWAKVAQDARRLATEYGNTADAAKAHLLHAIGNGSVLELGDGMQMVRKSVKRKGYTVEPSEYIEARFKTSKGE